MGTAKARGDLGEAFAAEKLEASGYRILERHYRFNHWEIDLIAQKEHLLAFIEVKLRSETSYASPAESVSAGQRRRIVLTAVAYLKKRGLYLTGQAQPRFDVFEVITDRPGSPKVVRYEHRIGAFGTEGLHVFI